MWGELGPGRDLSGLGMAGAGVGMIAGRMVSNPVIRMAVENGVEGAITGAGDYYNGPGPHTLQGAMAAAARNGATSAVPLPGIGNQVDPTSSTRLGALRPELADTFAGSRYTTSVLDTETVLYRAGVKDTPLGQFFSAAPRWGCCRDELIRHSLQSGSRPGNPPRWTLD